MSEEPLRRLLRARAAALAVALLVLGATAWVLDPVGAAFVGRTEGAATLDAGTVALGNDASSSAPFAVAAAQPNDAGARCVRVTYAGSLDGSVRLYAGAGGGLLSPALRVTVEAGSGSQADCADFALAESLVADQPLSTFAANATGWGSGLGSWSPAGGSGAGRTYRVAWRLPATTSPESQGAGANLTLTWEARSA